MDADRLLAVLGRLDNDSSVEAIFRELRTQRRPELSSDSRDTLLDWVPVRRQGVELGFVDEAYFEATDRWKRRRPDSRLVLFQVYFYFHREEFEPFAGDLPFGLNWADGPKEVRRKLQKIESLRRSHVRDAWHLPEFWITVTYKKPGTGMDSVVCQLDLKPWAEPGRIQPAEMANDWLDLFGMPSTSAHLRQRLRPLDLVKRIDEGEDDEEVEFRFECGLELDFTPAKNLKGVYRTRAGKKPSTLVLGAVRFFRARDLDARQWTGDLPFALSFDDTQATMLAKLRREPDEQEDDDIDGYALWRFADFSLHVLYDNMKNQLLRVSIMAPGFD